MSTPWWYCAPKIQTPCPVRQVGGDGSMLSPAPFPEPMILPPPPPVIWSQGYMLTQKYDLASGTTSAYYAVNASAHGEIFTHKASGRVISPANGMINIFNSGSATDPIAGHVSLPFTGLGGYSYQGTSGQGSMDPTTGDFFMCRRSPGTVIHVKPDNTFVEYVVPQPNKITAIGEGRFIVHRGDDGSLRKYGPEDNYTGSVIIATNKWNIAQMPAYDTPNNRIFYALWEGFDQRAVMVDTETNAYTVLGSFSGEGDYVAYSPVADRFFVAATLAPRARLEVYSPVTGKLPDLDFSSQILPGYDSYTGDMAVIGEILGVLHTQQLGNTRVHYVHLINASTGVVVHTRQLPTDVYDMFANQSDKTFYLGSSNFNDIYTVSAVAPYTEGTLNYPDGGHRVIGFL